jgi:hypothetical protein
VLLALLSDAAPAARSRLADLGVEREDVIADVLAVSPSGESTPLGHIPFTPGSKQILANAVTIAGDASAPIEIHHIAQGVVAVEDGLAAGVLRARTGLDQAALTSEIAHRLGGDAEPAALVSAPADDDARHCSFCGKPRDEVAKLIAGPGITICDQCVELCNRIIGDELTGRARLVDRVDELAAEIERLRRDLDTGG